MIKWISKISWGKVLLVGFYSTIIATIVHITEISKSTELLILSTIGYFTTGVFLTIIYYYLKDYLPKGYWKRATFFADLMVSTSFIFFTVPAYVQLHLPLAQVGGWFVSSFIVILGTSLIIVKTIQ
jgi:glucose-6-phosphate-specific signal transduction histidine kinase